jgi:hypothetical protein
MTARFSKGNYTAQVFAYEHDSTRLLREVQQYVAAGNALYGAVFLCRFIRQSSAIEKQTSITASSPTTPSPRSGRDSVINMDPNAVPCGKLTLTLLHIDTTWRFDGFNNRLASPKLSWPAVSKFFTPGTYVEADLILKDQHPASGGCPGPQSKNITRYKEGFANAGPGQVAPAHLVHVEISCHKESDAIVGDIARTLRKGLINWTRQLLFQSDPVQNRSARNFEYVLITEFDARHTAETIASGLDIESLCYVAEMHAASCLVRILSLEGSATYHNVTPRVPAALLPIDNRTHREAVSDKEPQDTKPPEESSYFGIKPNQYVHH